MDEKRLKQQLDFILEIENYWTLTLDQVVSYAYIMFYNLTFAGQSFTDKDILDYKDFLRTEKLKTEKEMKGEDGNESQ